MWFFGKDRQEQRLDELSQSLHLFSDSLLKAKEETANLHSWINHLYAENMKQQRQIQHISNQQTQPQVTREEIRQIVENHDAFERILSRIKQMEEKIEGVLVLKQKVSELEQNQKAIERLRGIAIPQQAQVSQPERKSQFREQIVKRLARNSKEYIKSAMLSLLKKYGKLTAMQLREILVEEQALCSKSSFYRLLDELQNEGALNSVDQGREKFYLARATKQAGV